MISVIVCTYNRALSLKNTLASIDKLMIPPEVEVELVVVDNNSNDDTKIVIECFAQTATITTRYVFEKKQGLSSARNAGVRAARGEILAFTDDDCVLDSSWLVALAEEFSSDPTLAILGGRIELYNPEDLPITIRTSLERAVFSSASQAFFFIAGCNMAFTRNVVVETGGFDCCLDLGSETPITAEDVDFIYRAYKKGFKVVYSPDVLVWHNHGRRTQEQGDKVKSGYLRGRGAFYCKHIFQGDYDILRMAYWEISALLKEILRDFRTGHSSISSRRILGLLLSGMMRRLVLALRLKTV